MSPDPDRAPAPVPVADAAEQGGEVWYSPTFGRCVGPSYAVPSDAVPLDPIPGLDRALELLRRVHRLWTTYPLESESWRAVMTEVGALVEDVEHE